MKVPGSHTGARIPTWKNGVPNGRSTDEMPRNSLITPSSATTSALM